MDEEEDNEVPGSAALRYEARRRRLDAEVAQAKAERQAFLQKFMLGPDVVSWVAPDGCAPSDEVLAEHMAQLRNVIRYALQYAFAEDEPLSASLSAANAATRMIQTNVALAKALKLSGSTNSKTVRGGRRKKEPQD
ncbi:MAG: hypothetical protein ACXWLQ_03675 [Rhizomicrobium sp.]|jgi:hypothetical protein